MARKIRLTRSVGIPNEKEILVSVEEEYHEEIADLGWDMAVSALLERLEKASAALLKAKANAKGEKKKEKKSRVGSSK